MTVIVTGAHGQVGRCLVALGGKGVTRAELDLSGAGTAGFRAAASSLFADSQRPDVMINTAAWTDVDGAEDVTNRRTVEAVNATAPGELARAAADAGVAFIHVSTDYVFSGTAPDGGRGWRPDDPVRPANEYGRTKSEGEQAVLAAGGTVVRTSWVWSGPEAPGRDFVSVMATLAENGVDPRVVDDQVGRPTYAPDLAGELWALAHVEVPPGILNVTNSGEPVSWCGFAREVFRYSGHDPARVAPCTTRDWPTPAVRPPWSVLDLEPWSTMTGRTPPDWRDSLRRGLGAGFRLG
ncbi:dTDP-4-dehydrorhamnose reductase [Corynebacterium glyciniphilum]|uniref:dTDP-4-dehydrorhamnose reductase n=1 Tax=Corynebacterium glyciniphilum TaxID=1404244 RepID=UPI0021B2E075|nr:dTDP-4-dehydrorhamnose reductase [Corynebacterium glyciniphilum]